MANPSNPNGANQYQLDPRQKLCWESYIDPKSATFGNALQSALKAGYEYETADRITTHDWFVAKRRRLNMLDKAEKVLDKTLDYVTEDLETGKVNVPLLKVQTDVATKVASFLGKDAGYEDSKTIFIMPNELMQKNDSDQSTSIDSNR